MYEQGSLDVTNDCTECNKINRVLFCLKSFSGLNIIFAV